MLLAVMGLPVADSAPAPDPEDWYANLLWFDRRKCLLLETVGLTFPCSSSGADRAQNPGPKSERGTVARTCCW